MMELISAIQEIFQENQDKITLSCVMELVEDVVESVLELTNVEMSDRENVKEKLVSIMRENIKSTMDKKRNVDKSE